MSAVTLVEGGLEALELIETLLSGAASVSTALTTAQQSGTALNITSIQASVAAAENAVLAAIASDPNKA
jgi:hypothetical protein